MLLLLLPYWLSSYRRFERSYFLHLQGLRCLRFVLGHADPCGRQHLGDTADPVPSVMSQNKHLLNAICIVCVLLRVPAVLTVLLNCNSTFSCTTWGASGSVYQGFGLLRCDSVCIGGPVDLLPSSSGQKSTSDWCKVLVGKSEGERPLGWTRRRWVDDIKMGLKNTVR